MQQVTKLRKTILNSDPVEWRQFENPSSWTLWEEELTISDIGHQGTGETASANEPDFLKRTQTDVHEKSTIRITYRGTPFNQLPVLHLDSDRFRILRPKVDQSTNKAYLDEYEAKLSEIIASENIKELRDNVIQLEIREG